MRYDVVFAIDARCSIAVEAESPEEAKNKALTEICDADLSVCEYVGSYPIMVEDSTGDIVWEIDGDVPGPLTVKDLNPEQYKQLCQS